MSSGRANVAGPGPRPSPPARPKNCFATLLMLVAPGLTAEPGFDPSHAVDGTLRLLLMMLCVVIVPAWLLLASEAPPWDVSDANSCSMVVSKSQQSGTSKPQTHSARPQMQRSSSDMPTALRVAVPTKGKVNVFVDLSVSYRHRSLICA